MSSSISSEEQRKAMMADPAVIDDDAASAVQQKEVIKKKTKKKTFRLPDDELELILAFKPSVHYPDPIFSPVLEEKLPDTVRGVRATMAKADALLEKNHDSISSEHARIQAEYQAKGYATYQAEVTDDEKEIIQVPRRGRRRHRPGVVKRKGEIKKIN
ncbi:unnamed protein product [Triticum turgidum subsp. durum]|uniref:Uncharacterized protein n=1 Tax=Triticum turgidum subsp. durum TaxID=4567 RepID=A0A9R1QS68_TRITD|nr:unnamed protein product [Triticum turgidum subsp. durum]